MKNDWDIKSLNEVCQIRPPKNELQGHLSQEDLVSFVPMDSLGIEKKYFTSSGDKKLKEVYGSYTYFRDHDVLLAKITPCFENGKLGIAKDLTNGIGFGSSEYVVYRPKEILDSEYLYYFLSQDGFRKTGESQMTGAVGHKRIPKDFYEKYEIPIPPLPEQKQIVQILDKAFAAIDQTKANIEQNIQNAQELFQSKLNEIFSQKGEGWEEKRLNELTTKIGSGATPRGGQATYKKSGISLIRSMNVHDNGFNEKNLAFIDTEQATKLSNVIVEEDDVLLNITGASVARCCIVENKYLPARVNQHVSIIRPIRNKIDSRFLHFTLTSKIVKDELLGIGEQGATRQAITKGQLENFKIRLPSSIDTQINLVHSIVKTKNKVLEIVETYKSKLTLLDELKKSILQKAFSGELTSGDVKEFDQINLAAEPTETYSS
ncbi:MAG: restriction endonuclease subunit S [Cyclobacteriaceae bacterium]